MNANDSRRRRWLVGVALVAAGCGPSRPEAVPDDAISIQVSKGSYVWSRCEAADAKAARCWIWNGGGVVLEAGLFLPLDGGEAPSGAELKVLQRRDNASIRQVTLQNGRVLAPEAKFEELKAYYDKHHNKR